MDLQEGVLVTNQRDSKSIITYHRLSRCFNHNHTEWHRKILKSQVTDKLVCKFTDHTVFHLVITDHRQYLCHKSQTYFQPFHKSQTLFLLKEPYWHSSMYLQVICMVIRLSMSLVMKVMRTLLILLSSENILISLDLFCLFRSTIATIPFCLVFSSPEHKVLMLSFYHLWMFGACPSVSLSSVHNLIANTLEDSFDQIVLKLGQNHL